MSFASNRSMFEGSRIPWRSGRGFEDGVGVLTKFANFNSMYSLKLIIIFDKFIHLFKKNVINLNFEIYL